MQRKRHKDTTVGYVGEYKGNEKFSGNKSRPAYLQDLYVPSNDKGTHPYENIWRQTTMWNPMIWNMIFHPDIDIIAPGGSGRRRFKKTQQG